MDKQFERRLDELFEDGERTEIYKLVKDQREALESIAYPANWPDQYPAGGEALPQYLNRVRNWMASVASNALTNAGKDV